MVRKMPMTARKAVKPLLGRPTPRLGPPTPARTSAGDFEAMAKKVGLSLFPWQSTVGRYLYALGPDGLWAYPEVASIVSRQNGKTSLLLPHILARMAMDRKIIHASHGLKLPRKFFFDKIVPAVEVLFPKAIIRRGAGQESVTLPSGGGYVIVAATGGAPRGFSADDLLLDEVRELDEDFVGSAMPTLTMSANPQVLYLSNAGEDSSDVLNAVRARADSDPSLAYLEWSASPERSADDVEGWAEANPSMGHVPHLITTLDRAYRSYSLSGNLSRFETEHLCRWVSTLREKFVDDAAWVACRGQDAPKPSLPALGVSLSPDGKRASVAMSWKVDKIVWVKLLYDVTGDPIDTDRLGTDIRRTAMRLGVTETGYDPLSDPELAKYVKAAKKKATSITGQTYAAASAQFVNLVEAKELRWIDADPVTDDLTWTSRKPDGEAGSYHAVRAQDDRPITAALAAIRAVWLASGPKPPSAPRIR